MHAVVSTSVVVLLWRLHKLSMPRAIHVQIQASCQTGGQTGTWYCGRRRRRGLYH